MRCRCKSPFKMSLVQILRITTVYAIEYLYWRSLYIYSLLLVVILHLLLLKFTSAMLIPRHTTIMSKFGRCSLYYCIIDPHKLRNSYHTVYSKEKGLLTASNVSNIFIHV